MRVLTQNLLGVHQDWSRRRAAVASWFHRLDPDVLTLQEAVVTDHFDQVADVVPEGFHIAHHPLRDEDGSGISIASRWPIAVVRELDLRIGPRTADFPASALIADIHWPHAEEPLLLVNHKPSWRTSLEHERGRQAVLTAGFVEEVVARTGQHAVVAGDFDAMPDAESVRFWRGAASLDGTSVAYRDVWQLTQGNEPGPTFAPSGMPLMTESWVRDLDRRIDYIFIRCTGGGGPSMSVTHCARVLDSPVDGVWGSDHFGVTAEFATANGNGRQW